MKAIVSVLLILLTSFSASAGDSLTALPNVRPMASVDSSCRSDLSDPFDLGWRISDEAPNVANHCVDATKVRPTQLLSENGDQVELANFFHEGKFWRARLFLNDVSSVSIMWKKIARDVQLVNVVHVQTRFYFHRGVQLVDPADGSKGPFLQSAVISWEPAFARDSRYNHMTTFFRNYPVVGRLISADEPMAEQLLAGSPTSVTTTEERKLEVGAPIANRLFENHILLSEERQYSLAYILLRRNCATNFFDILDETLSASNWASPAARFRTGISTDPILGPSIEALKLRGLAR